MSNLYTGAVPPQANNTGNVLAAVAAVGGITGAGIAAGFELFDVDYIDSVMEAGGQVAESAAEAAELDLMEMQQVGVIESALDYTGQDGGLSNFDRLGSHLSESWQENVSLENLVDKLTEGGIFEQEGGLSQAEFKEQLSEAITSYDVNSEELQELLKSENSTRAFAEFMENDADRVMELGNSNLRVAKLSDGEHIAIVDLAKTATIDEKNAGLVSSTLSGLTENNTPALRAVSENPLHDMPQALLSGGTLGAAGGAALTGVASVLTPDTKIAEAQYQQALQERNQIGLA